MRYVIYAINVLPNAYGAIYFFNVTYSDVTSILLYRPWSYN